MFEWHENQVRNRFSGGDGRGGAGLSISEVATEGGHRDGVGLDPQGDARAGPGTRVA